MNSKDFAIGILSTTAVILLVGLVILNARPDPAQASGMAAIGGEYILTVGTGGAADEELVYVFDATVAKFIVYWFDGTRGRIEIAQGVDLGELRKATATSTQPTQQRGRRSGSRGRRP